MNRKKFCIANWKMCLDNDKAYNFIKKFNDYHLNENVVVVCPSFTSLDLVSKLINKNYYYGAQNISNKENGSFTGEISISMVEELLCKYVIIGHSERRQHFNENDLIISEKLILINDTDITPIVCIGETLKEKESGNAVKVIEKQLNNIFNKININNNKDLIIAYEPVWAIGSGISAKQKDIEFMHTNIKNIIKNIYKNNCNIYLLYGGSVNETNAQKISKTKDVDGFLIGSASLNPQNFYNIYMKL